jgi:NitT/TauT family transport system ATP-binding protein
MTGDEHLLGSIPGGLEDLVVPASTGSGGLETITAGFIALADCAPLIIALEKGFARAEGLDLVLKREASWATIRDRIVFGHFDAAHMLAPMTVAISAGLSHRAVPVVTPFVLNHCGNAIAVSSGVHELMRATSEPFGMMQPAASGRALAAAVTAHGRTSAEPLCFAMTYPFSSHNYELRYFLAAAGIDPERDVRLVVVPPPMMVDAIRSGHVDGFCVGAPWPSVAVDAGVGHLIAASVAVKPKSPEKVVGVRAAWAERHPDRLDRFVRALQAAADWCEAPENWNELAAILARPDYVDAPVEVVGRALARRLVPSLGEAAEPVPDYIHFAGERVNRPDVTEALWYASQMLRWGQATDAAALQEAARASFRPDLYDRALGRANLGVEPAHAIQLFDGAVFGADVSGSLS